MRKVLVFSVNCLLIISTLMPSIPYGSANSPPTLSNGYVTPTSGDTSTLFYYYVHYYDPDGDSPTQRDVCIDGSAWHQMGLDSGSAFDGTYRCILTLSEGSHNYFFKFSDGEYTVLLPSSGTYSGPTVPLVRTISLRTETTDGLENVNNNLGTTIVFDSDPYSVPDTASKADGTYTAQANPPGSYSFHHWECSDGVSVSPAEKYSNPAQISVSEDGEFKAVFFYNITLVFSVGESYYPVEGLSYDGDSNITNNYANYDEGLYGLEDLDQDGRKDVLAYLYKTVDGSYTVFEYWIYCAYDNTRIGNVLPMHRHEHDFESVYLWIDPDYTITNVSLSHNEWTNNYWTSIEKTIYIGVEEGGHGMLKFDSYLQPVKPDNSFVTPLLFCGTFSESSVKATLYPHRIYTGSPLSDGFGSSGNLMTASWEWGPLPLHPGTLHADEKIFFPLYSASFMYVGWNIYKSLTDPILLKSSSPISWGCPGSVLYKLYMTGPWVRREFEYPSVRAERLGYSRWIKKTCVNAVWGWVSLVLFGDDIALGLFAELGVELYSNNPLLYGIINDPVNLSIVDSEGNFLGYKNGELVSDIPGGVVLSMNQNWELYFVFNNNTNLRYSILEQSFETYNFTVLAEWFNETISDIWFNATDIPLEAGSTHVYEMDWNLLAAGQDGTTVSVDCDGDGTFDQTWQSGTTLTADQMMRAHNLDTGFGYATIQEAINAPETLAGHIIKVQAGIYYENVVLSKSLVLIGENTGTTIIDGNNTGSCFQVTANNVCIEGFTITQSGSTYPDAGIRIHGDNVSIVGNVMLNCGLYSIFVYDSGGIVIQRNNITDSASAGIYLLDMKFGNTIVENRIINSNRGIVFDNSANNYVIGNTIANNNDVGIWGGAYNIFYHNNFLNNSDHVRIPSHENNTWDDGYPNGGNYWSDYAGVDANMDGVGDSSHELDSNNIDHYPLMGVFSDFPTALGEQTYHVTTVCNSTISAFQFDQVNRIIKFNVTGEESTGFCRICIPHDLIEPPYTVTIDGHPPQYVNYTIYDNGTHRWIYFTYLHSTHEVIIAQTPTAVGGIYISVNKLELLAPYIGLTILLAVVVATVGYVKKRKRDTEINS